MVRRDYNEPTCRSRSSHLLAHKRVLFVFYRLDDVALTVALDNLVPMLAGPQHKTEVWLAGVLSRALLTKYNLQQYRYRDILDITPRDDFGEAS